MTTSANLSGRSGAADVAYLQLKEMIVGGKLSSAPSVSESDLAALIGNSRTPLREALRRLESEHFLHRLPNGRISIAALSIKEARELFQVRSALESLVVEEATRNITEEWAARLREMQRTMEVLAVAGLIAEAVRQGDAFHLALVDLADNSVARWVLDGLRERLRCWQIAPEHSPGRTLQAAREHLAILELIVARCPEEAARMMRRHVESSINALVPHLEEQEEHSATP